MILSKKEKEFRTAYNTYYAHVLNTVRIRTRSFEDAEEICHDIFVDLYRKIETIENTRTWLFSAMNFAISNYYRLKANRNVDKIDIDDVLNDENASFVNGARDIRIILQDTINDTSLYESEQEQLLYELIAINNFSYARAGNQLGISKRKAHYLYQKISKRIIDKLNKKGIKRLEDIL